MATAPHCNRLGEWWVVSRHGATFPLAYRVAEANQFVLVMALSLQSVLGCRLRTLKAWREEVSQSSLLTPSQEETGLTSTYGSASAASNAHGTIRLSHRVQEYDTPNSGTCLMGWWRGRNVTRARPGVCRFLASTIRSDGAPALPLMSRGPPPSDAGRYP